MTDTVNALPRTALDRPLHSRGRHLAALALLVTAGVHLYLAPEHLREAPYIGVLFIALAVASLISAALLLLKDAPAAWWAAGLVNVLAVIAYVLSRSVGLPQIGDDIGNWTEPLGLIALGAEALTVVAALLALATTRAGRRAPGSPQR